MKKETLINILYFLSLTLIFVPFIFFPPTSDLAIYIQGGKEIFGSGKIYVDFIDIKAPLVFAFYGLFELIVGKSIISFRIIEVIFHICMLFFLFKITNQIFDKKIAKIATIIFALLLTSLNFEATYEPEVLSNLFTLILIFVQIKLNQVFSLKTNFLKVKTYYITKNRKMLNSFPKMNFNIATKIFISGFILGLLAAFKITFIFTSLSIVLFVLLNYKMNLRGFVKYFSYLFLGFVVSFALSHIWLLDPEILKGYILNIKYILFYSNIQKVGINFFKDSIKELSNFFGYNFSLLFTFGLFMTFLYFLKEKEKLSIGKEITISFTQIQFLNLSFFILIFEFLSIIVEKKFHSYHFARTMTVISILSSFGLYQIFNIVSYLFHWKNFIKYKSKSVILIIISIFFISLSPISKVIYSWKIPLSYFQGQEAYLNYISKLNPRLSSFKDMYEVSNFINNHFEKNTKILASFLGSYHIIYFLKIDLINSMPQRSTYLSKKIFINYYDKFIDEMNQCDIFLVQTDDRFKSLTENEYSSYEAIENNSKTKKILETNFHTIFKTKSFILFERNGFHAKNNVKK